MASSDKSATESERLKLEPLGDIPEDRAKNLQRREGFTYGVATLQWVQNGPKLGMGIKHNRDCVMVSRVDPGSLSEKCLVVGDHLCDVDGIAVTDKDVARDLLVRHIAETGKATFVVEHPVSIEAKEWAQNMLIVKRLKKNNK